MVIGRVVKGGAAERSGNLHPGGNYSLDMVASQGSKGFRQWPINKKTLLQEFEDKCNKQPNVSSPLVVLTHTHNNFTY